MQEVSLLSFNGFYFLWVIVWLIWWAVDLFLLAIPLKTEGVSFRDMEYSPLLGGFAVVLADGRGGFLSAETANFDCSVSSSPFINAFQTIEQVQGFR